MPEQAGRRGVGITGQNFEAPFDTPVVKLASKGLNLSALDAIAPDECSRLSNLVYQPMAGQARGRFGQTSLATAGTHVHSVGRLNAPRTGTFTRIWGIDTDLYGGQSGALTPIDAGYSGDPLTLVQYRPPLSADSWMFVGDRTRNRKVRATDNLDLPIGVTPPGLAITSALATEQLTNICLFTTVDGTTAGWTGTPGFGYGDTSTKPAGPVTIGNFGSGPGGPAGMFFRGDPGSAGNPFAANGYWYMAGRALPLNLALVGTRTAEDDDLIHLYLKLSHVEFIVEVRVYLVCSSAFTPSIVPGTSPTANQDFYVKAFSQHDFAKAVLLQQSMVDAGETARIHAIRDRDLTSREIDDARSAWEVRRAERDPRRNVAPQGPPGNGAWTEFGVLGVPLRRGDFKRVGSVAGRDWSTITGIILQITVGPKAGPVEVQLSGMYLFGGSGPDTFEPGAQPYDYRFTHYDTRTGAESNPSPEQPTAQQLDAGRREITLTPVAFGDSAMRQRFYRRGGSLVEDWYFLGENGSDGAVFSDRFTDAAIVSAGTVELDNDAFVTTVDEDGNTVHEQPLPVIFGPVEDLLLALGDPYRPGHVYWCKPGQPDAWPPQNTVEVCPPGEVLMNAGLWGGQAFCFSQEQMYWLYPNLAAQNQVSAAPTQCKRGLAGRWALCVTPYGIAFVHKDGIYLTGGGNPDSLTVGKLDALFDNQSANGLRPIDFTQEQALRLEYHDHELWFGYLDDQANPQVLVYSFQGSGWRHHGYGRKVSAIYSEVIGDGSATLIFGGRTTGAAYTQAGTSDDGLAITGQLRTGAVNFGRPREDKLLGDVILDADPQGTVLTVTTYLNEEAVVNNPFTLAATSGRNRFIFDPFGEKPQKARTLSAQVDWSSATARPVLYQLGASIIPQPDLTVNRVTQWDDLGHPDEVYLTGLTLDVDTGNVAREFLVEYDLQGVHLTLGPYTVQANNRHKFKFSWGVVKANLVRIRPIGDCLAWILYRADWIFDPEPPRIARWDINEENGWDQYVTGVDLDCNTFGAIKTVEVYIDGALVLTQPVATPGRRVVHLTVQPPVRGHLLRFIATDGNAGLLYAHRWHSDPEPSEQTNWNQNYTIAGALPDKYLKGILLECDTFGQTKDATIEVDGVVVETLAVNTNGRKVVEFSFAQHLGRVFRLLPTDANPGRLYSHQWIFDQEPMKLSRWESQLIDHGVPAPFQTLLLGHITLRSTALVTLTITVQLNQTGKLKDYVYELPPTQDRKVKQHVPFEAVKGVLFKYVLTSNQAFFLYREETQVIVQPWGAGTPHIVHPFGNDDLTVPTRSMIAADLAAARPGGGSQ